MFPSYLVPPVAELSHLLCDPLYTADHLHNPLCTDRHLDTAHLLHIHLHIVPAHPPVHTAHLLHIHLHTVPAHPPVHTAHHLDAHAHYLAHAHPPVLAHAHYLLHLLFHTPFLPAGKHQFMRTHENEL